jgi:cysteine desulfurase / selenocysteine lyase
MEKSEVRSYFPYLKNGKIYMNHAAISPLSSLVVQRVNEFLLERSETNIENYLTVIDTTTKLKGKLGALLNTDPDRLAFVDNTSNGLNILAQGMNWKAGDRIILNDIEFPSNVYPFLNLKPLGVEIDFVKSKDGIVSAEDVIAMIKPSTRLISISQVQFLTGYKVDLEQIGQVCSEKGIVFSVDGIQGVGAVPIDVQKCKIDFLAGGTQKWLMSLMGLAYIYVSEELQEQISPKYVGWTSVEDTWNLLNYDLKLRKSADCFQNGTTSSIGVTAFNASLDLFYMYGFDNVEKDILDNSEYFIKQLDSIGLSPILLGVPREFLSGIVSFRCNNPKTFYETLNSNGVECALREGIVRLSPHYYNTIEEIDTVIDILKKHKHN